MHLLADVEADGLLDTISTIWCLCLEEAGTGVVEVYSDYGGHKPLMFGLKKLSEAKTVTFHNGLGYDFWAINKLYPGTLRFEQIEDTLVLARLLFAEEKQHSLDHYGKLLGELKGSFKDFSKFSQEMVRYCIQDIVVLRKLRRHLQQTMDKYAGQYKIDWTRSVEVEHKVAFVLALQEQHGFRFDVPKAQSLLIDLREEKQKLEQELQEIFPPWFVSEGEFTPRRDDKRLGYVAGCPLTKIALQEFNPGSRAQVAARLIRKYGWEPDKRTENGNVCVDETVLSTLPYEEAKAMHRYMRLSKEIGQLSDGDNGWLKLVNSKGYIHGRVNPIGCATHRMSHFKPNVAQADKKDLRMRELWLPDHDEVLVGCDAEGIELRLLSSYLARYDNGAYAESVVYGDKALGTDAHSRTMTAIGLCLRDSAKRFIYAMIYGASYHALGEIIIDDARDGGKPKPKRLPSALGKTAKERIFTGIPGIQKLIEAISKAYKSKKSLIALDGRLIRVTSEHSALNYLLQSAGAIVMKHALAIFHFEEAVKLGLVDSSFIPTKLSYCANVHDEVQISTNKLHADSVGSTFANCITLAGERLGVRCLLTGTYDIGNNWKETH